MYYGGQVGFGYIVDMIYIVYISTYRHKSELHVKLGLIRTTNGSLFFFM